MSLAAAAQTSGGGWLPDGHAAALVLTFDVDAEAPILAEGARYGQRPGLMSHQAFGPEVGVPRILALLADLELRATFFVPGLTAERHPQLVEDLLGAGHEVGHHSYAHARYVTLSEAEEREDFERALDVLREQGATVSGHRAPLSSASMRTPALVAEHGLAYESTLMDDDRPYILDTGAGEIVELPPFWGLDDWLQYAFLPDPDIGQRISAPSEVLQGWRDELDAMRRHRCLCVPAIHPFVSGRAGRLAALRTLIEHALEVGDVAILSGAEVAERARQDPTLPRRALADLDPNPDPSIYPIP
ncbi:MAG TPA: polysaccharide deacetylase [Conexibacter sp.]|nr:polysaccharide deacetylase [Conexibacter sp.]